MTQPQSPAEPLLHAKLLAPRLYNGLIPREALLNRLDGGLRCKLILVNAPTGFGKTTLVNQWLTEREIPFAWVTLDKNDNDPARFWTYVISGLRQMIPAAGKDALAMLAVSPPTSSQNLLTALINDLSQSGTQGVLVMDDFQAITSNEILSQIEYLLQYLPLNLHLALITRSEPDLPLGILRARDELLEIDAASLQFSRDETGMFLHQTIHTELAPALLDSLLERSTGWPAGLRLAAAALNRRSNLEETETFLKTFSGSHHYIADYITREVFAGQQPDMQEFLVKTCFLDRLSSSLCDAVTGRTTGINALTRLERENLFVTRLENSQGQAWYRYIPLFAEAIQPLARQRLGEDGVAAIYEKASVWYEVHQLHAEAIEAALLTQNYERAIQLVEVFVERHSLSEMFTLNRWLDQLPETLTFRYPEICLMAAQVILFYADRFSPETATRMEPFLHKAEELWSAESNAGRVGEVLALRGMTLFWQGDYKHAFAYAYQSLEMLEEHDAHWRAISLLNAAAADLMAGQIVNAQDKILEGRALAGAMQNTYGVLAATQMLGDVFYWQGDHEQAAGIYQQIIEEAHGNDSMLDDQGIAHLGLANIAYEMNDLTRAEEMANRALSFAQRRANDHLQAQSVSRLALIAAARGHFSQAEERLKGIVAGLKNPVTLREIQCVQAQVAILRGEMATLGWWQSIIALDHPNLLPIQREREAFTLARLRLAQGQNEEARRLVAPWKSEAEKLGRLRSLVEAGCIEALADRAGGDLMHAAQTLAQVLESAQKKKFCRLILDNGTLMGNLLSEVGPLLSDRVMNLYATTLLHSFSNESDPQGKSSTLALVEPLSQQELRVLRLLVAGLSNADIARELIVSTNTVKTHVKNVYRKLDINSREEARLVAKELRLV